MRKTEFANGEYYHVFNRGVDKRRVFLDEADYGRFTISLQLLNIQENSLMERWRDFKKFNPRAKLKEFLDHQKIDFENKLVEIICFCLNPNHYHLILKQLEERGIEIFMHKLGTSHTNFFNKKNDRSGSLFQGPFKSVHMTSNDQLLYLSAYVNTNYYVHGCEKSLSLAQGVWPHSSLLDYLGERNETLFDKKIVLDQFGNVAEYKKYIRANVKHFREKKEMEECRLE